MNRSRGFIESAIAGVAILALTSVAPTARAQPPASGDPAAAPPATSSSTPPPAAATMPAPAPATMPAPAPATTPATTAAASTAAAPASAAGTAAAGDVTLDSPLQPSHRTAWPWIIIGTGVALVVTATILEVHAVSEDDQRTAAEDKLFSLPQGDPQRQPLQDARDSHDKSASTSRTEALIIGSIGFVAIAGAVVLWFVEGGSSGASASASSTAPTRRKPPSLLPRLAPGYAGGMLGASF